MKGLFFVLLYFVFCFAANAQKQFANGISLSVGTEYLPENDEFLIRDLTFTSKPNYGAQLGYERKMGKLFSIQLNTAYYFGKSIVETNFRDDIGNLFQGDLTKTIQRYEGKLGVDFWAVAKKKYHFT